MKKKTEPPILGVTMGDPAGIGPEVLVKALVGRDLYHVCRPLVIGSYPVMERTVRQLGVPLHIHPVRCLENLAHRPGTVPVLDPLPRPLRPFKMGRVNRETGAASVSFIEKAVALGMSNGIQGMVTAPINKEAIHRAGYTYPGHTEMLAALTKSSRVGMMILGGPLKIMFVTTHVGIGRLPHVLSPETIHRAIGLAHRALRDYFGVSRPRIGVAALNPHAGEQGLFGNEEQTCILPAVRRAKRAKINASGPWPADTLFGKAVRGAYDAVVAMYHDQGLIPLKLVAFGTCVNLTVGLPIIRTSVDHGTAFDIAGKGVADPGSFKEAVKLASQLAMRVKLPMKNKSLST